ncbi:MAG: hypothetical protein MR210_04110 [Erysipelotrichaceae bacterium]|nr:hypothetical protein [Erysipelotrichaceae bacterium]MDY5251660.1 hypothetical protein [Erysipelotrichaceae bacterium]
MLRILFYGFEFEKYLVISHHFNKLGISVACVKNPNSKVKSALRLEDRKFAKVGDEPILICDGISADNLRLLFGETQGLITYDGIIVTVTPTNREWKIKKLAHEVKCEKEAFHKIELLKIMLDKCGRIDISDAKAEEMVYLDKWISKATDICRLQNTDLAEINDVMEALSKIMKEYHI